MQTWGKQTTACTASVAVECCFHGPDLGNWDEFPFSWRLYRQPRKSWIGWLPAVLKQQRLNELLHMWGSPVLLGQYSLARSIANLISCSSPYFTLPFLVTFILFPLSLCIAPAYFSISLLYIVLFHQVEFSLMKVSSLIEKWLLFPSYEVSKQTRYRRKNSELRAEKYAEEIWSCVLSCIPL